MSVTSVYYGAGDVAPEVMMRLFGDTAKYALNEVAFSSQQNCEEKLQAVLEHVSSEGAPNMAPGSASAPAPVSSPVIFVCRLAPGASDGQIQDFLSKVAGQPGARASVNSNDFRAVYIPSDQVGTAREDLGRGVKIYALIAKDSGGCVSTGTGAIFAIILLAIIVMILVMPKGKPSPLLQFLFVFLAIVFFAIIVSFSA
jgi:hypothetical protein